MQPLAQELARAQTTRAWKVKIAFCPWAVLAFCA